MIPDFSEMFIDIKIFADIEGGSLIVSDMKFCIPLLVTALSVESQTEISLQHFVVMDKMFFVISAKLVTDPVRETEAQ